MSFDLAIAETATNPPCTRSQVFPEKMKASLTPDMLATDLAEYLVRKGVRSILSFRPSYPNSPFSPYIDPLP